jgi:hypothetical protein
MRKNAHFGHLMSEFATQIRYGKSKGGQSCNFRCQQAVRDYYALLSVINRQRQLQFFGSTTENYLMECVAVPCRPTDDDLSVVTR